MKKLLVLVFILTTCFGCSFLAKTFTSKKKPLFSQTNLSKDANKFFWENYHQGNYDSIPKIIEKLNHALQENPNDLRTTAHLGFVHIWALSERHRLTQINPAIIEHNTLSRRYFYEANQMNPHDPRILGFLADLTLAEGNQLNNKKQQTEGYFLGLKSIRMWPEFNKFTVGYIFSRLSPSDKNFKKGLEWQYETIDDCACEKNTRKTNYKSAIQKIKQSKDPKIYRTCWNTWIAPHNWEGFCLNWGDMLIKNGEIKEGIRIYMLAKESDSYDEWPYRSELENRIKNADQNVAYFNKPVDNQNYRSENVIMINSKFSCTGCHQMSKTEFINFGYQEPDERYYFIKTQKY
jgi:hypothetical protein